MRIWQVALRVAVVATLGAASVAAAEAEAGVVPGSGTSSVTVREIVPLETVLGYVAFDLNVSDEQLVQVRKALRGIHARREQVVTRILTSRMDMREVRSRVFSLRRQMLQSVSIILDEGQSRELLQAMGERQEGEGEETE